MTTINFLQPDLRDGIKRINYFNGRILTAEDMKKEQEACSETNRRTNLAAGEGVVYGLEISSGGKATDPVISVEPGMAISRSGSTLYLGRREEITVIPEKDDTSSQSPIFSQCATTTGFPTGFGAYVLIISTASEFEGYVSTNTITAASGGPNCGRKYITQGIQFNIVKVNPGLISSSSLSSYLAQSLDLTTEEDKHMSRNLLAHLCFGTQDKTVFYKDPFFKNVESNNVRDENHGLIEAMRKDGSLTDDDVPLALLLWTKGGLSFLDMWSVRRKTARKTPAGNWHLFLGERNPSESEACFLQFQSHIDDIIKKTYSISARKYFKFLPPLGIIPVQGSYVQSYIQEFGNQSQFQYIQDLSNKKKKILEYERFFLVRESGFHPSTFFNGMTFRQPVIIEGAKFEAAMRESISYPPVDTESGEFLWLYFIRENLESVVTDNGKPYLIFSSGHMPFIGDARYDAARWDFSNYSS